MLGPDSLLHLFRMAQRRYSATIGECAFLTGLALFFFCRRELISIHQIALRRGKAAALIYAALLAIKLYGARIGTALDLTAKAYLFSAFPGMCPEGSPKPGYRVFLCYKYWVIEFAHRACS